MLCCFAFECLYWTFMMAMAVVLVWVALYVLLCCVPIVLRFSFILFVCPRLKIIV